MPCPCFPSHLLAWILASSSWNSCIFAVIFYIRDDINRKFSGLITNLNLEKIYGVTREQNTATVYFDYRYTSVRNQGNILYEKGKMTFIKFNSGKWFNAELSIYLIDAYPFSLNPDQKVKEE